MSDPEYPQDILQLLKLILRTQEDNLKLSVEAQAQISSILTALVSLDARAASLYSEQLEIERAKRRAVLEQNLKDIALLRATVSKLVN